MYKLLAHTAEKLSFLCTELVQKLVNRLKKKNKLKYTHTIKQMLFAFHSLLKKKCLVLSLSSSPSQNMLLMNRTNCCPLLHATDCTCILNAQITTCCIVLNKLLLRTGSRSSLFTLQRVLFIFRHAGAVFLLFNTSSSTLPFRCTNIKHI